MKKIIPSINQLYMARTVGLCGSQARQLGQEVLAAINGLSRDVLSRAIERFNRPFNGHLPKLCRRIICKLSASSHIIRPTAT